MNFIGFYFLNRNIFKLNKKKNLFYKMKRFFEILEKITKKL